MKKSQDLRLWVLRFRKRRAPNVHLPFQSEARDLRLAPRCVPERGFLNTVHIDRLICLYRVHVFLWLRFLRGDQYATALALLDDGKVVLGVLACPNLPLQPISSNNQPSLLGDVGCLFFSTVGAGTYMQSLTGSTLTKVRPPMKFYSGVLFLSWKKN